MVLGGSTLIYFTFNRLISQFNEFYSANYSPKCSSDIQMKRIVNIRFHKINKPSAVTTALNMKLIARCFFLKNKSQLKQQKPKQLPTQGYHTTRRSLTNLKKYI